MSYFHAKVQFLRQQDNGLIKKVAEQYLVDAMSWTETESRVMQEVGEGIREVTIVDISRSPVQEVVFYGDTDLWFKCKVAYRLADEESEKEKKITIYILVNANDAHQAYERCGEHLKGMLVPFEIPKVEETAICDIYQYQKPVPAGYKPTKDSSAEVWAALPEKSKESIKFGINDGHYDEHIQGRFLEETFAVDAIRYGMEKKAFKDLIAYVECIVINKHGHMNEDEDGEL